MASEFVVLIDGELKTYKNYADIPETFDNIIKFMPEAPPPPHTEEQHKEMKTWNAKLLNLMERESASRNKNR